MENRSSATTPAEAREALASMVEAKSRLADHVKSPGWLYPLQGVGVAVFIVGIAFSKYDVGFASTALVIAMVLFCILPLLQQTPSRVVFDVYTHRGSRGLALIYLLLLVLLAVAATGAVSMGGTSLIWAVYAAAAMSLVLTIVMGPRMDARLERAIRTGR